MPSGETILSSKGLFHPAEKSAAITADWELKQDKLKLDIRHTFLTVRVVNRWNKRPREAVDSSRSRPFWADLRLRQAQRRQPGNALWPVVYGSSDCRTWWFLLPKAGLRQREKTPRNQKCQHKPPCVLHFAPTLLIETEQLLKDKAKEPGLPLEAGQGEKDPPALMDV